MKYIDVAYDQSVKPKTDYPAQMMRHVVQDVAKVSGGLAIDIGCGRGDQLLALQQLGFQTIGVDLEQSAELEEEVVVCDLGADKVPLDDGIADFIISKSVIEHLYLPQITNFLDNIQRLLKPNGKVVIATPDWHFTYREFYLAYTHVTPFTASSLGECLKMHGFQNVSVQSFIQLPEVWERPWLRHVCDVINLTPLPKSSHKWVKWSKDRMLLAVAEKPEA